MKESLFRFYTLVLFAAVVLRAMPLHAAAVEVPIVAPTRLQTLERKAGEYERYRSQYQSIQTLLDDMLALLPTDEESGVPTPTAGYGMLADLLEKAKRSDELSREVENVRIELDQMQQQRDTLKKELEEIRIEHSTAAETIQAGKDEAEKWKSKVAGLRETIDRLLLGEFEYYEVKEGDSLQGIAANTMVYGNASRAAWLRQVNEGRVMHLDNLTPGEILIVPRFPRDGLYEF